MQELEKWIEENRRTMHESVICEDLRLLGTGQSAIRESDLRALLSRFVLCDSIAVDCHECSGDGYHWGRVNRANKRIGCVTCNQTGKLYAPANKGENNAG